MLFDLGRYQLLIKPNNSFYTLPFDFVLLQFLIFIQKRRFYVLDF